MLIKNLLEISHGKRVIYLPIYTSILWVIDLSAIPGCNLASWLAGDEQQAQEPEWRSPQERDGKDRKGKFRIGQTPS